MTKLYAFMLDLFPLSSAVYEENQLLAQELQRAAVRLLLKMRKEQLAELQLLLRVSHDLGYMDGDIFAYLDKELKKAARYVRFPLREK